MITIEDLVENTDHTFLARIVARNGSGSATGIPGEGNWIQSTNVSAIVRNIYDRDSDTPDTPDTTNLTPASSYVIDTPVTSNALWTKDATGYNFLDDVAGSKFANPNHRYVIEYKFTLTGGAVFYAVFSGITRSIITD